VEHRSTNHDQGMPSCPKGSAPSKDPELVKLCALLKFDQLGLSGACLGMLGNFMLYWGISCFI
jgi:hypothetical protein